MINGSSSNLAIAYFSLLNFGKAREHGARAPAIYPNNVIVRANYALYAMYAGNFEAAELEAGNVIKLDASFYKAYLVQAVAAFVRGDLNGTRAAYAKMEKTGPLGASTANLRPRGSGDIGRQVRRGDRDPDAGPGRGH